MRRDGEEYLGQTRNLSLGGVSLWVALDPPPRIGERLQVSFRIPTLEGPIEVQAEVRWRNDLDHAHIGLQFVTGLRAKQTWALGRYFETLAAAVPAEP